MHAPRAAAEAAPHQSACGRPGRLRFVRDRLRFVRGRLQGLRRLDLALARALGRCLSDRAYLACGHRLYLGYWPDYRRPRALMEHVQAYMLRCRSPALHVSADKAATREDVARRIGAQYLVPLVGVYDSAEAVPLASLPRPCVIKVTVGSGKVWFLRPGESPDLAQLRLELARLLRQDFSRQSREWCYRGLRNRVIVEHMLTDAQGRVPADYKFYVIGGEVRLLQVDRGRFGRHTRNLYDPQWTLLQERLTLDNHAPDERPPRLEEMLALTRQLAEPYEFLRVDWYVLGDEIYVGELTNYPGAGFERLIPHDFALALGRHWTVRPRPDDVRL